jgi:thymidylate synthase (FAD)
MMTQSNIKVELIDHMGSDLTVANAARVSFDKMSEINLDGSLKDKDKKLIKYLADHNHWSPFAHCFAQFRIKAPVIVARQLVKHQIGLTWNEMSRRYVASSPEFYQVDKWRKRADNVKQGSSNEEIIWLNREQRVDSLYWKVMQTCDEAYQTMLDAGVCPEQARMVLPLSMMTEWIWSGSLYAFARVALLRLDSHSQHETSLVAQQISSSMENIFPVSWDVLLNTKSEPADINDYLNKVHMQTTNEQKLNLNNLYQIYLNSRGR